MHTYILSFQSILSTFNSSTDHLCGVLISYDVLTVTTAQLWHASGPISRLDNNSASFLGCSGSRSFISIGNKRDDGRTFNSSQAINFASCIDIQICLSWSTFAVYSFSLQTRLRLLLDFRMHLRHTY